MPLEILHQPVRGNGRILYEGQNFFPAFQLVKDRHGRLAHSPKALLFGDRGGQVGVIGQLFPGKHLPGPAGLCDTGVPVVAVELDEQHVVGSGRNLVPQGRIAVAGQVEQRLVHDLDARRTHGQQKLNRSRRADDIVEKSNHQAVVGRPIGQAECQAGGNAKGSLGPGEQPPEVEAAPAHQPPEVVTGGVAAHRGVSRLDGFGVVAVEPIKGLKSGRQVVEGDARDIGQPDHPAAAQHHLGVD